MAVGMSQRLSEWQMPSPQSSPTGVGEGAGEVVCLHIHPFFQVMNVDDAFLE